MLQLEVDLLNIHLVFLESLVLFFEVILEIIELLTTQFFLLFETVSTLNFNLIILI